MRKKVGAEYLNNSCRFRVWCPNANKVEVLVENGPLIPLHKEDLGYWEIIVDDLAPDQFYKYLIDGKEFPDPASRAQPQGVHSWSQIIPDAFDWRDESWKGIPIKEMIIYELHVGTFSIEGTFAGIIEKLDHLLELGVNTLELMPVSQFPGNRNWGYDGVYPFAVQNSYGGPTALKDLIDICHRKGFAVLLDVVYNHLGPEGNYLAEFGPYFTEKYQTPWGHAINFDDEYSDEVRNFFLQNALMWLEEFHFDGLRLDAVHEIIDRGAKHFLQELCEAVDALEKKTGQSYVLIAESDLNDSRIVSAREEGGYGLEGQWVDDFHHSIHTYLTGENQGYYSDYGDLTKLQKTLQQGFVYDGMYSSFRKKSVGNSPESCSPWNFVVSIQNHDQVGNRVLGERLSSLLSFEALKLSAGLLLVSRYVPMLFMGEEFGEKNPFLYFVSHGDKDLVKQVQKGRKKEFQYFLKDENDFPDPQDEHTFQRSRLSWDYNSDPEGENLFKYYKKLIQLRKQRAFAAFRKPGFRVDIPGEDMISLSGEGKETDVVVGVNLSKTPKAFFLPKEKEWELVLASADKEWGGPEEFRRSLDRNPEFTIPPESLAIFQSFRTSPKN